MNDTRQRLLDAATRVLAEQGVENASLLEIARRADQRNRGAVHYHFGSREGLVVAVLEQYADYLAQREGEMLNAARERPDDDLASAIAAIVRPCVQLAEEGWRGACYLQVVAELVEVPLASMDPEVAAMLTKTGGEPVFALIHERMPPMSDDLRVERVSLLTLFVLRSIADRARAADRANGRPQLDTETFTGNLIAMSTAMLTAPTEV
ncbi:TetR/AcrR family transcriptional regulator [Nocardioides anomalus]|uniref:TetR/AcrR family transcriptional regulator n=1 Tax=Nocardioides anomalus TaxID=2712223 RepID=A0A6G6WFW3_9ACTN|nr:TetR/AcrR family transcriptional regulator [Nocardioides anomalus]QIG44099.1 TetR/AcrR family transcriptional regulator [Nocardioides anomalus]